ncbi:MAG: SDR family oxidoreductase [Proteobacteria bacterium]|jgi:NADP-dependent 3-hydroxy acid dehydrogenase YdfG|nr:SDR family oxidoreductase [Gammaproteobacteria bacterium]MDC1013864.1 SDR family oxidoreductase [Gammaproteobacteria bacterium]NBW84647.1 SDR family oxidoreductase [Pseudomonadota bacterium]
MNNLENRVVMITGASSGFGKEIAKMCVAKKAKVVLGARREDKLQELCAELGQDQATYQVTDVTSKEDLHSLARHGIDTFGQIDSLINNAGVMPLSLLQKGRTEEWDQMIDVNIKGVLYGIDSVYAHMLERESGQIINISSVAGKRVMPGSSVYSATKFAVRAISEGLRLESAGKIQVTCIYPGAFTTELAFSIKDESMMEALIARGLGDIAQPAERVAEATIYALEQDPGVAVNEIVIRPTAQEA